MLIYRTGLPGKSKGPDKFWRTKLDPSFYFAAPSAYHAGQWAGLMDLQGQPKLVLSVNAAYHRYVSDPKQPRNQNNNFEAYPIEVEIIKHPYGAPWDGRLESLLNSNECHIPMYEVLFRQQDVLDLRTFNYEETKDYVRGFEELKEVNWGFKNLQQERKKVKDMLSNTRKLDSVSKAQKKEMILEALQL